MTEKSYRLLVAEDEPAIREPVVTFLTHLGYQVDAAENGIEALHHIRMNSYDLIILDIKMPFIDGKQLTLALQDENIRIPILVTTAIETHETFYQEAGRLHKIFTLRALEEKVRSILKACYSTEK